MNTKLLSAIIASLLSSCAPAGPSIPESGSALAAATQQRLDQIGLPGVRRVLAFSLNPGQENPNQLHVMVMEGGLNPARLPLQGQELTDAQVNRLLDAAATSEHPGPHARCFYPRHGFVFLNAAGDRVSHYTVSVDCLGCVAGPGAFVKEPDYDKLKALIGSLKLPKS